MPNVSGMRRAGLVGALALCIVAVVRVPAAGADTALVTLDAPTADLTAGSGGQQTASIGFTNLTDGDVTIRAASGECTITVGDGSAVTLPAAVHTSVTVGISGSCASEQSVPLSITATSGSATQSLDVTASASSSPQVDWGVLLSFVWAALVALAVVLGVYVYWSRGAGRGFRRSFLKPLALDSSWSFSDSWVTNTTAASGLIVVVVGSSDFLTAVLGSNAQAAIGLSTVAGLIALALVGAAGTLVLTVRTPDQTEITVGGLLLGSIVALGAAGGQLWAVYLGLGDVSLGGGRELILGVAVAASILLVAYGLISINNLLTIGTAPASVSDAFASPPSAEVAAAAVIAASNLGTVDRAYVETLLTALAPAPTSAHHHAARRRRSALP